MADSDAIVDALQALALRYPEVEETGACVKRAFKVRKKGFAYLGSTEAGMNLMVKLVASRPEAEARAAAEPERYTVGKAGWVTVRFPAGVAPPAGLLERWIDESFRLQAPKGVVAALPERGPPT